MSESKKQIFEELHSFPNNQAGTFAYSTMGVNLMSERIQILNKCNANPDNQVGSRLAEIIC